MMKSLRSYRNIILSVLVALMLVNLVLSVYIQLEKEHNLALIPPELRGKCFENATGGAGCGAVQTSEYASTFGISNPVLGYVAFPILALLILFIISLKRYPSSVHNLSVLAAFGLLVGSAFSLWLVYAQFFLIGAICVYCLFVDSIMVLSTIVFLVVQWPVLFRARR